MFVKNHFWIAIHHSRSELEKTNSFPLTFTECSDSIVYNVTVCVCVCVYLYISIYVGWAKVGLQL